MKTAFGGDVLSSGEVRFRRPQQSHGAAVHLGFIGKVSAAI